MTRMTDDGRRTTDEKTVAMDWEKGKGIREGRIVIRDPWRQAVGGNDADYLMFRQINLVLRIGNDLPEFWMISNGVPERIKF